MDYLTISALVFEVLVLAYLDYKLFRTWFTPFNLVAWPYTVVAVLAFFFAPAMGFVSLYTPSVLIWMVGLLVFWATGFVIGLVFECGPDSSPEQRDIGQRFSDNSARTVATWTSVAIMPVLVFNLYRALESVGGWLHVGTYEFKVAYEHGVAAHALQVALPLCVYLIATYKRGRNTGTLIAVLLLLFISFTQVKGTILSVIVSVVVFRATHLRSRVPLKALAAGVLASYVLFNTVYLVALATSDSSVLTDGNMYAFLARHYMYYLWSGVLAFGQALRTNVGTIGGDWFLLFAPFINIYRFVLGGGPMVIAGGPLELGVDVDPTNITVGEGTNVYTMFGTLHYYLGPCGAALLAIVMAACFYGLLLMCKRSQSEWAWVLYALIGSWLVFSFFEFYFASLGFPETILDCVMLSAATRYLKRDRPPLSMRHTRLQFRKV